MKVVGTFSSFPCIFTWLSIVDNVLIFPMDIYTSSYNQRFKSYRFWKLTELLKLDSGQNGVTRAIRSLDHLRNGNPVNTENESCRYFLKFPAHLYMTYSGKQKPGNRFGFRGRIRFRVRTELRNNWIRNEVWLIIFSDWAAFQSANPSVQFYLFETGWVLNERSLLNSKLTSNGRDLGKTCYIKVVDNFDNFAASMNKPIYDKRFRSKDFWKSRGATGNSSFLDRLSWTDAFGIRVFIPAKTITPSFMAKLNAHE
jgi:hypothetical protein